jgi:hypothetical protein
MMGDSGGSLLARAVAVTVLVIGFFAVATGAVPVRCWIGGACDGVKPEKAVAALPAAPAPVAAAPAAAVESLVGKAAPTLTSNDVIAGTFAQLKVELNPPTQLAATTAPVQVAAASPSLPATETITNPETGLSKRVVRAVAIRADGTPETSSSVAEAYAAGPRVALAPPSPAVDAAARIGAGQQPAADTQTVADLSPVPESKAATPLKSDQASVTGKGANVRTSPSKAGKILFALRSGEIVTIVGSKRGWMKVKDDQNRTGWMYGDALKRG